ncbi:ankyrin repeat domain-containing protein, partial [Wolbachia endosymbiont of Pentidionis agamae]|uniref:ankyrin repeat domain-containing protein n=1 Tax=Wolbachia endosymbiont of Pentidionis agamae TaxID=3110435 RepID=UPI002FD210D3
SENAVFNEGKRAVHLAVEHSADKCLEELLRKDCDINVQDNNGMTPIMYALKKCNEEDMELRTKQENVVKLLMQSSELNANLVDRNGSTCAHFAAQHSNLFALKFFKNIDPSIFSMKDKTANQP